MSELLKKCSSCQENKELAYFSKHAACKMGVSHICRECDKLKAQARRLRIAALLSDLPASSSSEYSSIVEGEKFCSQCSVSKPLDLFRKDPKSGKHGITCKDCKNKKYRGKYKQYASDKYQRNKESVKLINKEYRLKNKAKYREYKKKQRKKPIERIRSGLRKRLKNLLDGQNQHSGSIGCSRKELMASLESKFLSGMTWDNYGPGREKWSVDHIKPISLFNLEIAEERKAANHFSNLQPLWGHWNELKEASYDPDHPMGWKGLDALLSDEDKVILGERLNYKF